MRDADPSTPLVDFTVVLSTDAPAGTPVVLVGPRSPSMSSAVVSGRATFVLALPRGMCELRATVDVAGRGSAAATIVVDLM